MGTGRTADVWGFTEYAIKLFRHRGGLFVPSNMTAEITTYERLGLTEDTGFPVDAHGQFDNPAEEASACGWAVIREYRGSVLLRDPQKSHPRRTRSLGGG